MTVSERIQLRMPPLRNYADERKFTEAWGAPDGDPYTFAHHSIGGWGVFVIPPPVEVWPWVVKAAKRPDAIRYLFRLAQYGLYSQLTLSEALTFARDLRDVMPEYTANRDMVMEWATFGVHAVNAHEARVAADKPQMVGDELKAVDEIGRIITWKDSAMLDIAERGIAALRSQARGRKWNQTTSTLAGGH